MVLSLMEDPLLSIVNGTAVIVFSIAEDYPSVPLSNIKWMLNNVLINNGLDPLYDQYSFSSDLLTLTISNVQHSDEGNYTMVATNRAGTDSDTVFLEVEGKKVHVMSNQWYV